MNKWDRNNLNFIMNASPDVLQDWMRTVTDDDLDYAFELLLKANAELDVRVMELNDDVQDLSEANAVIGKVMSL